MIRIIFWFVGFVISFWILGKVMPKEQTTGELNDNWKIARWVLSIFFPGLSAVIAVVILLLQGKLSETWNEAKQDAKDATSGE